MSDEIKEKAIDSVAGIIENGLNIPNPLAFITFVIIVLGSILVGGIGLAEYYFQTNMIIRMDENNVLIRQQIKNEETMSKELIDQVSDIDTIFRSKVSDLFPPMKKKIKYNFDQ